MFRLLKLIFSEEEMNELKSKFEIKKNNEEQLLSNEELNKKPVDNKIPFK